MKKFITLLAVTITSLAAFTPTTSQAYDRHSYSNRSFSHTCGTCRTPIYRERVVIGRDRHGCLQYGYRTVSHRCSPSHGHSSHGHHHHSSSRGGFNLPGFFFGFGR